jgi:hypothetical protein
MPATLRTETTVLRGHRIEISAPELPEGTRVEVIFRKGSRGQESLRTDSPLFRSRELPRGTV